jgi:hypothetical protein
MRDEAMSYVYCHGEISVGSIDFALYKFIVVECINYAKRERGRAKQFAEI